MKSKRNYSKKVEPEIIAVFHKLDAESQKTFLQLQKRFGETANALDEALGKAGIKSDEEMQRIARSALDAFRTIEDSGRVTGANLGAAWVQLREDILPVLDRMPVDFQERFRRMEARFPQFVRKAEQPLTFIEETVREVSRSMTNSFEDFLFNASQGFINFGDFAVSALNAIQRSLSSVFAGLATQGIQAGITAAFPSLGGIFGIQRAQHGLIATRPQVALFGEAGPEAVLPLSRDPSGNLGVTAIPDRSGSLQASKEKEERALTIVNLIDPGSITQAGLQSAGAKNIIINEIKGDLLRRGPIFKTIRTGR